MPAFVLIGASSSARLGLSGLGLMKLGTNSVLLGRAEIDLDFVPTEFTVRRAAEGPQLLISWSDPISASAYPYEYQLRRGSSFFPRTISHGDLVDSGTSDGDVVVSDRTNLLADRVYYYTLFVKDPTQSSSPSADPAWFTHPAIQGHSLAIQTGYWRNKLYDLLPNIYRVMDTRPDLGGLFGQSKIGTTSGASTGDRPFEAFNFSESQHERQGQLKRFLKLPGVILDEVRRLVEYHTKDLDPRTVHGFMLELLAGNIGWETGNGIPLLSSRLETANAVHFYKTKGTAGGLEDQASASAVTDRVWAAEPRTAVLLTTTTTKDFGEHHAGEDRLGLPTNDTLVETGSNAPGLLNKGARALQFFGGRGSVTYDPGYLLYQYGEDTPDTRAAMVYPGEFTVEFWIRVNRWPKFNTELSFYYSASDPVIPVSSDQHSHAAVIIQSYGTVAKALYRIDLHTTRQATTGAESHALIVRSGAVGDHDTTVMILPEAEGTLYEGNSVHIALTRKVTLGPGGIPSPEPDDTLWSLYVNGSLYDSVSRPTGDSFASSVTAADAIAVGSVAPLAATIHGGDYVIDQLRAWRVARTAAQIAEYYDSAINPHYPNLTLYSGFDDTQNAPELDGTVQLGVAVDTSSVEGDAAYVSPSAAIASPLSRAGDPPRHVGAVAPDKLATSGYYDEVRRRDEIIGMREGFVVSEQHHLRSVRLRIHPSKHRHVTE